MGDNRITILSSVERLHSLVARMCDKGVIKRGYATMPSVQEHPSKRHQLPGPAAMLAELSRVTARGYQITSVTELQFEGPVPPIQYVDVRAQDPDERRVLPILMPHGDHWHLYIYTLAKPEILAPDRPNTLTDQTLNALASLSMDERATVPARGHA